jgi:hypothetical protein
MLGLWEANGRTVLPGVVVFFNEVYFCITCLLILLRGLSQPPHAGELHPQIPNRRSWSNLPLDSSYLSVS